MVGCCWCTTATCYKDNDAVVWYVGNSANNAADPNNPSRKPYRRLNGSDSSLGQDSS